MFGIQKGNIRVGEAITTTFRIFKDSFWRIVLSVIIVSIPSTIAEFFILQNVDFNLDNFVNKMMQYMINQTSVSAAELEILTTNFLMYAGITLIFTLLMLIPQICVILIAKANIENVNLTFNDVFETAVRRFPLILLTDVIQLLLVGIGLTWCFYIVGILLYIFLFYTIYAEVFHHVSLFKALKESIRIGKKNFLVFFVSAALYIGYIFTNSLTMSAILIFIPTGIASNIVTVVLTIIEDILNVLPIVLFTVFFDMMIKNQE